MQGRGLEADIGWIEIRLRDAGGREGIDELPTERRNVVDDAAPDEGPVPERGLVDPRRPRVHEVVADPERAGRASAGHDAGRDRDEAAVADDPDRAPRRVDGPDQVQD